jgi:hypothetical protein
MTEQLNEQPTEQRTERVTVMIVDDQPPFRAAARAVVDRVAGLRARRRSGIRAKKRSTTSSSDVPATSSSWTSTWVNSTGSRRPGIITGDNRPSR